MAFEPHPRSVLASAPPRLTTWHRRVELLRAMGADEVIRLEPTESLLALDPEQFVRSRILSHGVSHIVEGPDFRFGRKRAGDTGVLRVLGEGLGFGVEVVEPVRTALADRRGVPVSSSLVRWLLAHGRVRDAEAALGRPYDIEGTVVEGDRIGRTIGFPTANLAEDTALPGPGVYAADAGLDDGRVFPAAINVGDRPTVHGRHVRCEAHLLDIPTDPHGHAAIPGVPEYGWRMRLSLRARLRDQVRFGSLAELQSQLTRDIHRARTMLTPPQVG